MNTKTKPRYITATQKQKATSVVAKCHDCDWSNSDLQEALAMARVHAQKKGHGVEVLSSYRAFHSGRPDDLAAKGPYSVVR